MFVEMNTERVRSLREGKGMSRRDLAAAAGISPQTAGRAERGEPVRAPTARALAAALGERPSPELGRPVRSFVTDPGMTIDPSAFIAEIGRLMEARGIADLRELHERFMDQVPQRIGNARWTFGRFRRHATHHVEYYDARFLVPLAKALEADDDERFRLAYAWGFGRLPGAASA